MKTQSEFRAHALMHIIPKLLDLVKTKGGQYTGEEASVFLNFEQGAEKMNETKEQYLMNPIRNVAYAHRLFCRWGWEYWKVGPIPPLWGEELEHYKPEK